MSLQFAGTKSEPSTPSTYIWASAKSCTRSSFKSPMMATPPHSPLQSIKAVPYGSPAQSVNVGQSVKIVVCKSPPERSSSMHTTAQLFSVLVSYRPKASGS